MNGGADQEPKDKKRLNAGHVTLRDTHVNDEILKAASFCFVASVSGSCHCV